MLPCMMIKGKKFVFRCTRGEFEHSLEFPQGSTCSRNGRSGLKIWKPVLSVAVLFCYRMSLRNIAEDRHWQQVSVAMKRDLQEFTHEKGSSEDECVLDLLQVRCKSLWLVSLTPTLMMMMAKALANLSHC